VATQINPSRFNGFPTETAEAVAAP